ncbi:ParA family protein [Bacillus velezensis]|uniref:ParA family protein n=1 Tax=Bacillus TaxID=1386 RepID=UPI0028F87928|nr:MULTISPECIES: ParA family protein [Bacillus]MDU0078282.1 ParA family protein [Bacillus sp. IG2]MDU0103966.1 ParA family protein [Bacillus sp. IS1]MDX7897512.1 ParA family protein [Bacillus velezensis]MDX8028485.1 ParA family protein [Bacillus velezensis]MDX8201732.1 ParA family protein [Bacillus velezensis]
MLFLIDNNHNHNNNHNHVIIIVIKDEEGGNTMTAKIITFGISKGGCSKSTTSGITAWLLSENKRVLCIDMDGQGNLTSFLTGEYDICNVFEEKTILEAIKEENAKPYILKISENLHLIPSNDYLATLPRIMYQEKKGLNALTKALRPVMDDYDYIIIDTPPNLGEQTVLSLSTYSPAGSYAVIMFDGSMFCYYAIQKFLDIVTEAQKRQNDKLQLAGILFAIIDSRAKENDAMVELIDEEYPNMRFDSMIRRKAATRRLPINGFLDNKELSSALEYYIPFVKELEKRVK